MTANLKKDITTGQLRQNMSFNQKVWTLTAQIPAGKIATYSQIAQKLNSKAYRAVGNALNKNPYAPQVPCHRVVGKDGSLTGFAQGLTKKKKLLINENIKFAGNKVAQNQQHKFK